MEMMESVAIPDMATALAPGEDCWYCKEKKPTDDKTNEEAESPPSPESDSADNVQENYEHNDASKLGANLEANKESRPNWKMNHKVDPEDPIAEGTETDIVPGAHHLIPGNASMNKAKGLHKYMVWDGDNSLGLSGPIGYNINCYQNGVWLPGNYAVRDGTVFGKTWTAFKSGFQEEYAKRAMHNSGNRQLHDAHRKYNTNAQNTLIQIARKLDGLFKADDKCRLCGKQLEDKSRPPYGLIARLHRVSAEHEKALKFPQSNKKAINNNYYTSTSVKKVYG